MRTSHVKRSISLLTAFLFIFSLAPSSFSQSPAAADPSLTTAQQSRGTYHLPLITLPSSLGSVEYSRSGSGPQVVHIQTAHGSYEAGKNIAAILEHLDKQYGFKDLFVEGAYGDLNTGVLRFFPDDMDKTLRVADELLKRGYLEGEELYLAQTPDARLYGIEDEQLYKENESSFIEVIRQRNLAQKYLNQMDEGISRIASQYLDKNVREFLNAWRDHELERIPLTAWTQTLYNAAQKIGWDLKDPGYQFELPMLVRLYNIQEMTQNFDFAKFEAEKKTFLAQIRGQSPFSKLGKKGTVPLFALLSDHASPNPLSAAEAWSIVAEMVRTLPADFPYDSYPMVKKYIGQQLLQKELMGAALMDETVKLREKILERMVTSDAERETAALMKDYFLLKKLFELKLTRAEYQSFGPRRTSEPRAPGHEPRKNADPSNNLSVPSAIPLPQPASVDRGPWTGDREKSVARSPWPVAQEKTVARGPWPVALIPSSIAHRFEVVNRSGRVRNVEFSHLEDLDTLYAKAMEFYRLAEERDSAMLQKLEAGMRARGVNKAVVITGGFHSEAFREHFAGTGDDYTLLTPRLTSFSNASFETYVKAIFRQAESSKQAAAGTMKQRGFASLIATDLGVAIMAVRQTGLDQPEDLSRLETSFRAEVRTDPSRRAALGILLGAAASTVTPSIAQTNAATDPKRRARELLNRIKQRQQLTLAELVELSELAEAYKKDFFLGPEFARNFEPAVYQTLDAFFLKFKTGSLSVVEEEASLTSISRHPATSERNSKKLYEELFALANATILPLEHRESAIKIILLSENTLWLKKIETMFTSSNLSIYTRLYFLYGFARVSNQMTSKDTVGFMRGSLANGKMRSGLMEALLSLQDNERDIRNRAIGYLTNIGAYGLPILAEYALKTTTETEATMAIAAIRKIIETASPKEVFEVLPFIEKRQPKIKSSSTKAEIETIMKELEKASRSETRLQTLDYGLQNEDQRLSTLSKRFAAGIVPIVLAEEAVTVDERTALALETGFAVRSLEQAPGMGFETQAFTTVGFAAARETLTAFIEKVGKLERPMRVPFEGLEAILSQDAPPAEKNRAVLDLLKLMFKLSALANDKLVFEVAPETFNAVRPLYNQAVAELPLENTGWTPAKAAAVIQASSAKSVPLPDLAVALDPDENLASNVAALDEDAGGHRVAIAGPNANYPAATPLTIVAALLKDAIVEGLPRVGRFYRLSPRFSGFTLALAALVNQAFAAKRIESAA